MSNAHTHTPSLVGVAVHVHRMYTTSRKSGLPNLPLSFFLLFFLFHQQLLTACLYVFIISN